MSGNIDRIEAQRDMRTLSVMASSQSGEAAEAHRQRLNIEAGEIVKVPPEAKAMLNAEKDADGIETLKAMAAESGWQ